MQTLVSCPDCSVPAEITESFCLPSTDGPVDHIVLHCAAGHHFRMAADRLPALQRQPQPDAPNDHVLTRALVSQDHATTDEIAGHGHGSPIRQRAR